MFMKHYAPNRFEPSIEVIMKMGVQWGGGSGFFFFFFFFFGGGGCQGRCERERRILVIVKIKQIGGVGSGQGESERRITVFDIKKKIGGRGGEGSG